MSVYFVAQITVHDLEGFKKYEEGFDQVFSKYKGKVLAVDEAPMVIEGSVSHQRTVLVWFPNEDEAMSWYQSTEYQEIALHRFNASEGSAILVQGWD